MKSNIEHKIFRIKDSSFEPEAKKGEFVLCDKSKLPQVKGRCWNAAEIKAAAEWFVRPLVPTQIKHIKGAGDVLVPEI